MNPCAEIFSQGSEVVTGQVVNSNAAWLSEQLVELGFILTRHTAVGDKLSDLIGLLTEIAPRVDCCICSGGLGPTSDDLTAEAVAQAFNLPLHFDAQAFKQISTYFQQRGQTMPSVNRKQALLPQGAMRIDNNWGTAPGFCLIYQRCFFVFLPGVPFEMKHIFAAKIKPLLQRQFVLVPQPLVILRTFGIGESSLQECVNQISLPDDISVGYRAALDEVQVKLLFPHSYSLPAMTAITGELADKIGEPVFAVDRLNEESGGNLVAVVSQLFNRFQKTLAVVETISCGLFAAKCVGQSWLLESYYQATLIKIAQKLGVTVDSNDLNTTATRIAQQLQHDSGADYALVQLNQAVDTQVTLLYTALATPQTVHFETKKVSGTLQRQQNQAALWGFDLIRRCFV